MHVWTVPLSTSQILTSILNSLQCRATIRVLPESCIEPCSKKYIEFITYTTSKLNSQHNPDLKDMCLFDSMLMGFVTECVAVSYVKQLENYIHICMCLLHVILD